MEKFQKIGVTAFVLSGDERVLLLRRSKKEKFLPGYFELPGGKVDFGENPEKALEREVKEETGLDILVKRPYSLFSYISDDGNRQTVDIQFLTKTNSSENVILSNAHDEFIWINKNDLNKIDKISNEMKKVITKGFNNLDDQEKY